MMLATDRSKQRMNIFKFTLRAVFGGFTQSFLGLDPYFVPLGLYNSYTNKEYI